MKRILSIIFLIGTMLMCLTACGGKGFDGKWDCAKASVDTYDGVLDGAYNAIEENGGVSILCEVEIDDDNVKYSENLKEYDVVRVKRNGDTITLTLEGSFGIESTAELEYNKAKDSITVFHNNNEYTLERADFLHKVVLGLPWWVYFVFVGVIVLIIVGKIFASKNARNAKNKPNFNTPNGNIPQFAPRQMPMGGQPTQTVQQPQQGNMNAPYNQQPQQGNMNAPYNQPPQQGNMNIPYNQQPQQRNMNTPYNQQPQQGNMNAPYVQQHSSTNVPNQQQSTPTDYNSNNSSQNRDH